MHDRSIGGLPDCLAYYMGKEQSREHWGHRDYIGHYN